MKPHHIIVRLLVLSLLLFLNAGLRAQAVFHKQLLFDRPFVIASSASSPDGSVILCCTGAYSSPSEVEVVKIDATGSLIWGTQLQYPKGGLIIRSTVVGADGSILIAGHRVDSGLFPFARPLLVSLTPTGTVQWAYQYNIAGAETSVETLCRTSDSGIVVAGNLGNWDSSAGLVFKVNAAGRLQWHSIMKLVDPRASRTTFSQVAEDHDSTILIVGHSSIDGTAFFQGIHFVKMSLQGTVLDTVTYKGPNHFFYPHALVLLPNKTFAIGSGAFAVPKDKSNSIVSVYNGLRNRVWSNNYKVFSAEALVTLSLATDGTMIGITNWGFGTDVRNWHYIKLGLDGTLLAAAESIDHRSSPYTVAPFYHSSGQSCVVTRTGDSATTTIELRTVSDSLTGCSIQRTLGTIEPVEIEGIIIPLLFAPVTATFDQVPLTQHSFTPISSSIICSQEVSEVSSEATNSLSLFPNPAAKNSIITISLPNQIVHRSIVVVRDLTGKIVMRSNTSVSPDRQLPVSTDGLPNGIYTIELLDENTLSKIWRGKVVVQ